MMRSHHRDITITIL